MDGDGGAGLGGAARETPAGLGAAPREPPVGLGAAEMEGAAPAGLAAAPRGAPADLGGAPRAAPAGLGGASRAAPAGLGGASRAAPAGLARRPPPGDSIEWTDANTTIICSLFAKQVKKGNRSNTHLNSVGYDEVSNEFFNLTAIRLTKRQMKNKWDKLKTDLTTWKKLMRKQTGAGWDIARGVTDEWWKKARAEIPGCGKFRKKTLQNEEDLTVMFANITNDESDHWNPMSSNPIIPPTQEDVDNGHVNEVHDVPDDCDDDGVAWDETDEVQEVTPSPTILLANKRISPAKKQRTGTTKVIQEQVTKIVESASSFTSKKLGEVHVQQVMDLVLECGAGYDTDEHYIATELFVKKDQREMFMTLPTNEIRFNWLRRKYNAKYGN
uniref:Myb/SANT-like domain-containing protein n=1 Tax=Setaria viridis TaxID=4556 RepID=A0A4U6U260_SETVI|nr:hypothetical protein SEVIR_6G115200v2 [Setaria viridis]